jgi:predicted dehydrogenase
VPKLRVGIVGCGEVTQVIHLPALRHLSDLFTVTALCDISQHVLQGVADQFRHVKTYADHRDLVADPDVDVVLVANPHIFHAEVAMAAMEAGKDVFLEKPIAVSLAEVDALAEVEARTGRTLQVGYMRRYAGAFLEAVDLVKRERGKSHFARVQDIIGKNALIVQDTSNVIRDPALDDAGRAAFKAREHAIVEEIIGSPSQQLFHAYALLLGLSSHDVSAMRELLGRPKSVLHATHRWDGRFITAVFDYGDFVCEFATGVDMLPRFDTFIEVYGDEVTLRLDYETPYIRNQPARLTVTRPAGEAGIARTVSFPSRLDSFVVEWKAFHRNVLAGTKPKTTIADARQDLEIFMEIMGLLKAGATAERVHGVRTVRSHDEAKT